MIIVNKSDYLKADIKRLTRIVLKRLKKSFVIRVPISEIVVESYASPKWEGHYSGGTSVTVRIGRKISFPCKWDGLVDMPKWEDLYVGLLTWCLMLHYQRLSWLNREKKGLKYSRVDCQEITVRMIQRWRVDDAYKLVLEKAFAND